MVRGELGVGHSVSALGVRQQRFQETGVEGVGGGEGAATRLEHLSLRRQHEPATHPQLLLGLLTLVPIGVEDGVQIGLEFGHHVREGTLGKVDC